MTDNDIIDQALSILESRLHKPKQHFSRSKDVKRYLTLKYAEKEQEIFNVMYLNNQHGLISLKDMFHGSINSAAVYPREIVKAALHFNAAAVILAHNHPSGRCEPSQQDRDITRHISEILGLIDVKVIDHIVVSGCDTYSFADHGLL